jgi:hypothetical protein
MCSASLVCWPHEQRERKEMLWLNGFEKIDMIRSG